MNWNEVFAIVVPILSAGLAAYISLLNRISSLEVKLAEQGGQLRTEMATLRGELRSEMQQGFAQVGERLARLEPRPVSDVRAAK